MERSESRTRERDDARATGADDRSGADDGGVRGRLRSRAGRLFSIRAFLFSLVLAALGLFAGGVVPLPLVGNLAGLLGVALAGLALGLGGRRRYLEVALAGALAVGVATTLDYLVVALVGDAGTSLAAIGAGAGAVAGVLGHYLGRDLYAGVTRDL